MAALRVSPWAKPIIGGDPGGDPASGDEARARATKKEALGFDDVADVDRIIYSVSAAGADVPTLVVARGRFQPARVEDAFRARWPGAVADRWRGVLALASGENAVAVLSPKTFVSGAPRGVRAVVDRAFGEGAAIDADPALGPTRRALCPESQRAWPAVLIAMSVDDRLRARVGSAWPLPRELRRFGLRLDLGQTLDLQALAQLDHHDAAVAFARRVAEALGDPVLRAGLRSVGLDALLADVRITIDGAQVRARLSVADEHRAEVTAVLKVLVDSLRGRERGALAAPSM